MLSVLVIFGVNYFFPTPKETPQNDIIVTPEVESTETIVTNENLTEEKIQDIIDKIISDNTENPAPEGEGSGETVAVSRY